ncbi:type II secretion system F family protein [Candidatus Woesearchaeota archaeon]|nr:type II secretion system F family protein [Candidatus Woesearchaeota archaeon]
MAFEFLAEIGQAFVPKRFRPNLRNYLLKAGIDDVPYKFFGGLFFSAVFFTIVTYFAFLHKEIADRGLLVVGFTAFFYVLLVALVLSGIIILFIYFYLNIKIYNRTRDLEDKLVDYLTLVSTNLKGGLSFEKSLWMSIKPDFGILAKEVGLVSKKVMTGNDLSEALIEFSMKYDSPNLRRSINLIIGEIESGGAIVEVIDKVIENLRKTRLLKAEMAASTVTFMIFIGAIVLFISPVLFALSGQLLQVIIGFAAKIGGSLGNSSQVALPITINEISLDPQLFRNFSMMAITTISVSSAFIISIIEKGNIKGGLRYVPLFVTVALIVFILASRLLTGVFGNFVQF